MSDKPTSGRQGMERENAAKEWFEKLLKINFTTDLPFAEIVKDGEILCRLISTFNESLIPKINEKPSRSFLAKENLHFFLGACEELGVPRYLLPGVDDVYNAKNGRSVVECIEALAAIIQAQLAVGDSRLPPELLLMNNRESNKVHRLVSVVNNQHLSRHTSVVHIAEKMVLPSMNLHVSASASSALDRPTPKSISTDNFQVVIGGETSTVYSIEIKKESSTVKEAMPSLENLKDEEMNLNATTNSQNSVEDTHQKEIQNEATEVTSLTNSPANEVPTLVEEKKDESNAQDASLRPRTPRAQHSPRPGGSPVTLATPRAEHFEPHELQEQSSTPETQTPDKEVGVQQTTPRIEAKLQTPRDSEAKPQTPRVEAKLQTPRAEEARPQTPRTEEGKLQTPRIDGAKSQTPRTEGVQPQTTESASTTPRTLKIEETPSIAEEKEEAEESKGQPQASFSSSSSSSTSSNLASTSSSTTADSSVNFTIPGSSFTIREWSERDVKSITLIQSLVRGRIGRRCYGLLVRANAYRARVAREILETEKVYVDSLKTVVKLFLRPLKNACRHPDGLVNEKQCKQIFSNIEVILNYNSKLLVDLEKRVHLWSPQQLLGDIFLMITHFLKTYTEYVTNYDTAIQTLRECRNDPRFIKFLDEISHHPEVQKQQLSSFLIKPIQRIPRYEMLLNDLVRHTQKDHPDYTNLASAASKIREVAVYVEAKKNEAEAVCKVLEVQSRIGGKCPNFVTPTRRFIREGVLITEKKKEMMFFLFNDVLVVSKIVGKNKKGGLFTRQKAKEDLPYTFYAQYALVKHRIEIVDKEVTSFALYDMDKKDVVLRLFASSTEEKTTWISDLSKLGDKARNPDPGTLEQKDSTIPNGSVREKSHTVTRISLATLTGYSGASTSALSPRPVAAIHYDGIDDKESWRKSTEGRLEKVTQYLRGSKPKTPDHGGTIRVTPSEAANLAMALNSQTSPISVKSTTPTATATATIGTTIPTTTTTTTAPTAAATPRPITTPRGRNVTNPTS